MSARKEEAQQTKGKKENLRGRGGENLDALRTGEDGEDGGKSDGEAHHDPDAAQQVALVEEGEDGECRHHGGEDGDDQLGRAFEPAVFDYPELLAGFLFMRVRNR